MARKNSKVKLKYKRNTGGLAVMYAVSVIVGAVGVAGWLLGPGDEAARIIFAALAGAAAFVVPIGAGQLGRSRTSWLMLPAMLVFAGWTAYSTEHANKVLVEAPLEAAHNAKQADTLAKVATLEARVVALRVKRDAIEPEAITCQPCLNTRAQADKRYNDRQAKADADIVKAQQDVTDAKGEVEPFVTAAPWWAVLAFGAALDLVLALAVFSLESTARLNRQKAEDSDRREREYAEKQQSRKNSAPHRRAKPSKKAGGPVTEEEQTFLLQARGPRLVVDNG